MHDTVMVIAVVEVFICSKIGLNLSEMEVRMFVSIKKVSCDQMLAFSALIFEEKLFFSNLYCLHLFPVCFSFVSHQGHFSSKSPAKSSKKMFQFNFQLSGNNSRFLGPKCYLMLCS